MPFAVGEGFDDCQKPERVSTVDEGNVQWDVSLKEYGQGEKDGEARVERGLEVRSCEVRSCHDEFYNLT